MSKCLKFTAILAGIVLALTGCKKDETDKTWLSLDTTYFPFGREYEWTYERYSYSMKADEIRDESYDTFVIKVIDSTYGPEGWEFSLEGGYFRDFPKILGKEVVVFPYAVETILLEPLPGTYPGQGEFSNWWKLIVEYNVDTLSLSGIEYYGEYPREGSDLITLRLKGKGVVKQSHIRYDGAWTDGHNDSLLSFTTPEGQVCP
ncbi:MAG: hypothetical protein E3J71_08905 [Candidatus Stahlbacteria bacterium]|nr:MAG: hypothetical protein E3J71_08905 [Candidatus Stahlbacteria bacterium]